jgi:proteasome lid subunit RPN8/RPN11
MIAPESDVGSDLWKAEGFATRIQYACAVIEELGSAATEGFNRMSHGGVEIGGVLFGFRTPDSIEICAQRALACEYAFGPSFTLSENDRRTLDDLLASVATDPDLEGMQPVGWYHSHTRSDISLSEKDLEVYSRYFPEPWQIALVLRPYRFDPVRAGFFFREPDGSVHAKATRQEFVIPLKSRKPVALLHQQQDDDAVKSDCHEPVVRLLPAARSLALQTSMAFPEPRSKTTVISRGHAPATALARLRWLWVMGILALVSAAATYWLGNFHADSGVSLRALDVGGQLRIDWNRDARAIRNGASGILEIEDGSANVRNELSRDELRAGSVTYLRNSGNVLVRLQVRGARDSVIETTRFLGSPPQSATAPAVKAADRHSSELPVTEYSRDRSAPAPAGQAPSMLQSDAHTVKEARSTVEVVSLAPAVPSSTVRSFVTPSASPARIRSVDVVPPAVLTSASNTMPVLPELLPHLPQPPEVTKQLYRGPSEGKIIWAGKLARHGTIEIQGNRASQGYVTGGLPGVPVRVQVFPAEFTPGGLRIFTADAKGIGSTEAPGAQNGWNRTSYVLNPAQADRLRLIEPPSPQNAWNRVMVRAERGDHSIIVFRWELAGTDAAPATSSSLVR